MLWGWGPPFWGWGPPFSARSPPFGAGVLPLGLVLLKQCPAPCGRVLAPVHMLGMEVKLRALRCFLSETGGAGASPCLSGTILLLCNLNAAVLYLLCLSVHAVYSPRKRHL